MHCKSKQQRYYVFNVVYFRTPKYTEKMWVPVIGLLLIQATGTVNVTCSQLVHE